MDIIKLARPMTAYPDADAVINNMAAELVHLSRQDAIIAVRDVLCGLARAEIKGYISDGSEREWATLAVRANQMAIEEGRKDD